MSRAAVRAENLYFVNGPGLRARNIVKREMRWHDFGSGREAHRSQYREYWQGERQCHGPKLVPAPGGAEGPHPLLGVAAKTGGTPKRGAGAPLAGMRPRRRAQGPRMMACSRPAAGSHPSIERLEPAPPCAGHFVGRLDHIRDMLCAVLRVSTNFDSQRTRVSLCYGLLGRITFRRGARRNHVPARPAAARNPVQAAAGCREVALNTPRGIGGLLDAGHR